jgi:hypothetical protein
MDKTTLNRERGAQPDAGQSAAQEPPQRPEGAGSGELVVLPPPEPCGMDWPVCPFCHGVRLHMGFCGHAACPSCNRWWDSVAVTPCPWPREATLTDRSGLRAKTVCASHASIPGSEVYPHDRFAHA